MAPTSNRYACPGCGYVYDEEAGDPHEGFAPGTAWSEVPDDWACPDCGVREKVDFEPADRSSSDDSSDMAMTEVRPVRERVLDATAAVTVESGWGAVTMGKVAGLAGVSRQTVYNEYGTKPGLGQAMVLRELDRFLAVVAHELETADDLVRAIRSAAEQTLLMARANPLLHTVLTSAHAVSSGGSQADTELLPFLTTDAAPLITAAKSVILERLGRFPDLGLDDAAARRGDRRDRPAGAQPRHAAGRHAAADRRRPGVDRPTGAVQRRVDLSRAGPCRACPPRTSRAAPPSSESPLSASGSARGFFSGFRSSGSWSSVMPSPDSSSDVDSLMAGVVPLGPRLEPARAIRVTPIRSGGSRPGDLDPGGNGLPGQAGWWLSPGPVVGWSPGSTTVCGCHRPGPRRVASCQESATPGVRRPPAPGWVKVSVPALSGHVRLGVTSRRGGVMSWGGTSEARSR